MATSDDLLQETEKHICNQSQMGSVTARTDILLMDYDNGMNVPQFHSIKRSVRDRFKDNFSSSLTVPSLPAPAGDSFADSTLSLLVVDIVSLSLCMTSQYVCSSPLPFALTTSCRASTQCCFPAAISKLAVASESWILPGRPVVSMREAVLTVSPKSWKRARSPLRTPAVTGPECRPQRKSRSAVSGPKETSS